MDALFATGTDHQLVDTWQLGRLPAREQLVAGLLERRDRREIRGFVVLATCNRTELYVDSAARLELELGVPVFRHEGADAARHLIRVAGSLESMVIGENQILGQVRDAWLTAQRDGHSTTLLDDVFRQAVRGAREIRTKTSLGTRPVSVASVAARELTDHLERPAHDSTIAIIGAGEMARKAALNLTKRDSHLVFVNRTAAKANDLADEFGGSALPLSAFLASPPALDALFVAARGTEPIVDTTLIDKIARPGSRLVVVDVCVPSAVEAAVATRRDACVIDMDRIRQRSARHTAERREAAARAAPIVDHHVATLLRRLHGRKLDLGGVRSAHLDLAAREFEARCAHELDHLGSDDRERLRRILEHLAKAHAHLHLESLKDGSHRYARQ